MAVIHKIHCPDWKGQDHASPQSRTSLYHTHTHTHTSMDIYTNERTNALFHILCNKSGDFFFISNALYLLTIFYSLFLWFGNALSSINQNV